MRIFVRMGGVCLVVLAVVFSTQGYAAQAFTLQQAVSTALERNFSVVSAQAGRDAATEGRKAAFSDFAPTLSTTYDYLHRQHNMTPSGQMQDPELFSWRAGLTQNLFAGFATLSSYQKASLAKEGAEAGVSKARVDLIRTVQEHFFLYLKAKQNVVSARDSLERLRVQLASSKAFYDAGLTPRLDVLQAEVDVSTAEGVLLVAENSVETEKARLNTLLILPLDAPVEYVGNLDPVPFSRTLEACLTHAYAHRPDLIIVEKAAAMAGKDITIAGQDFYPRVNAFAGWSTVGDNPFVSGSHYMSQRFSGWSVGMTAEWAVFDWGKTYYRVQQARKIEGKVKADASNLRQEVAYEVKARISDMGEASKRITIARTALDQGREAYRMAAARYKSQVGTMTDVLTAQSKLTLAEASLAGAKADYSIALARLFAAMGEENVGLNAR